MKFKSALFPSILLIFINLLLNFESKSQPLENAIFDILHYDIHISDIDFSEKSFVGFTRIELVSLTSDLLQINLMLKSLTTDSINADQNIKDWSHQNENIVINLHNKLSIGDTLNLNIFYHGQPTKDLLWGGVYFSNSDDGYVYNMGVGFNDKPHNYGRVWFPCVDDFTDKATYDFFITTNSNKVAICGGLLVDSTLQGNSIEWHWNLNQEISTYLASFAVGNYTILQSEYSNSFGIKQILNACHSSDSANFLKTFSHLNDCIDIFEKYYLPYQFGRVGFVGVPFNSGAMEHATNIAFPNYAITGDLTYEKLMAHEFSHHWWGNLVTCKTPEDMWINEGWAVYSEHLFVENLYGKKAYDIEVQSNHKNVLQFAHINDGAVYPLSPVPHDITYGTHVYDKGADVVHTLRSYLGDSLFFIGVGKFLNNMKFQNASSDDLRDSLSKYTGYDLTNFFNNWVFTKGFPHFYIYSFNVDEQNEAEIEIRNNPKYNQEEYINVPLEMSFYNEKWETFTLSFTIPNNQYKFKIKLPFKPIFAIIDPDRKLSDARTIDQIRLYNTGKSELPHTYIELNIKELSDSALVFVEHHWNGPEVLNTTKTGVRFSDYRYWTVSGIFPPTFIADAKIDYNGRDNSSASGTNYLDYTLNIENEDSLVLMYRENVSNPWNVYADYDLVTGSSKTNKIGYIIIKNIQPGEYCLGYLDYTSSIKSIQPNMMKMYPNPAQNEVIVEFEGSIPKYLNLYDINGKIVWHLKKVNNNKIKIDVSKIDSGTYILEAKFDKFIEKQKLIINQ